MFNIIRSFLEKISKFTPAHRGRLRLLRERGQAVVITAVAFMAILAFMGLVTDVGTLYLNFTRLKRALDSAAVAAANNIKDSSLPQAQRKSNIQKAAREMLSFNEIEDITTMEVYTCTDSSIPTEFDDACPDPGEKQRKLAWVQATQNSPLYFLRLFGINNIPITTHSIGEAATLDVVIVIDTSESMANETGDWDPLDYDPSACNASNTCQPLRDAKDAAKAMVDKFFDGKDRVALVTYNVRASTIDPDGSTSTLLESDHADVKTAIDTIKLFNGPGVPELTAGGKDPRYGDTNPMDIDGDGNYYESMDIIQSTCTGCGIRVAGEILKKQGRVDSVWVIVLLSDGTTNVSDLPPSVYDANSPVDPSFVNGFCGGSFGNRLWTNENGTSYSWCTDQDPTTRHCGPFHAGSSECPPGATWVGNASPPYDTDDYAYDMTDRVALLESTNANEPTPGDDIAIYTIGLGQAAESYYNYAGEELLRYMANIGDNNRRDTGADDPCHGMAHAKNCGQYYYAKSGSYLQAIFEDIAGSIYTRISE